MQTPFVKSSLAGLALAVSLAWTPASEARVTRIIIDSTTTPACITRNAAGVCTLSDIRYELLTGRAFGELDPNDPLNGLITDIQLSPRNANGNVEYIASFVITARPRCPARISSSPICPDTLIKSATEVPAGPFPFSNVNPTWSPGRAFTFSSRDGANRP